MKKERKKEKKKEKEKSRIRQIRELCRITLIPEVVRIRALFYREIIPRKDPYTIQTQLRIQKSISASESFFFLHISLLRSQHKCGVTFDSLISFYGNSPIRFSKPSFWIFIKRWSDGRAVMFVFAIFWHNLVWGNVFIYEFYNNVLVTVLIQWKPSGRRQRRKWTHTTMTNI